MSDLISRSEAIKTIRNHGIYGSGYSDSERENDVIDMLESVPTVEAKPVVYGEWQKYTISKLFTHTCNICHCDVNEKTPYCPWCGADMRKEEQHE